MKIILIILFYEVLKSIVKKIFYKFANHESI
jgi:hypothetical protein